MTNCLELSPIDVPKIEKKPGNCGAGIIVPNPQPPLNLPQRSVGVFETPSKKLFSNWLGYFNKGNITLDETIGFPIPGQSSPYGDLGDEYFYHLFTFSIPATAQRGDKINHVVTLNARPEAIGGASTALSLPHLQFARPTSMQSMMMVSFQLGIEFRPNFPNYINELSGLLYPDSLAMYCAKTWHSLDSINIQSWYPFIATCCVQNILAMPERPLAQPSSFTTASYMPIQFGYGGAAANWGIFANQRTNLLFYELPRDPGGGPAPSF